MSAKMHVLTAAKPLVCATLFFHGAVMPLTCSLAAAIFCSIAAVADEWPLVIIRHTGDINDNPKVFAYPTQTDTYHRAL